MEDLVMTTVRLPRAQLKTLRLRAVEEGKSVAEIVRDSIGLYLGEEHRAPGEPARVFPYSGPYGHSGLSDGSANHDKYLYGWEK